MRRRAVRTLALTVLIAAAAPAAPAAEFLGAHTWAPDWPGAGGFSALWLGADGAAFVALSDRGTWVTGTLARDAAGAVSDVEVTAHGPLLRSTGEPLKGRETDAEGIAWADGGFYVSFEGAHRVIRHAGTIDSVPERLPQHPHFERLQANSGLEALAADAEGRIYAIPERSGRGDRPFPVYVLEDGVWRQPFTLRRDGGFLVAGADIGPDGRLYLLERSFQLIGFASRIRSFDLQGGDERLEMESALRQHDNLEGLSIWRDAEGRIRATMLSDDNQRIVQRTEFVDYVLSGPSEG